MSLKSKTVEKKKGEESEINKGSLHGLLWCVCVCVGGGGVCLKFSDIREGGEEDQTSSTDTDLVGFKRKKKKTKIIPMRMRKKEGNGWSCVDDGVLSSSSLLLWK